MSSGNDAVHDVMEAKCGNCKWFLHGTDGGSIAFEGKSYGFCEKSKERSPFFVVPMRPPDPDRPNDPWNHWKPDMSGERMAKLAVLPEHYCSGFSERS